MKLEGVPADTVGEVSTEGASELCRVRVLVALENDAVLVLRNSDTECDAGDKDSAASSSSTIVSSFIPLSVSSSASSCEDVGLCSGPYSAASFDEPDPEACPFAEGGSG